MIRLGIVVPCYNEEKSPAIDYQSPSGIAQATNQRRPRYCIEALIDMDPSDCQKPDGV